MTFELFDRDEAFDITRRKLPHWYQPGVTYFVTFRTFDSMPAEVLDRWHADRHEWLRLNGIDPTSVGWEGRLAQLAADRKAAFHRRFSAAYHAALDRGLGECPLRSPEIARIVSDNLLHFDGVRYRMAAFIVMPNHVHLLVCLLGNTKVTAQCKSWKHFTAARINKALGRQGHFWQAESFDHLVRGGVQFEYLLRYIADNPSKAGLRAGEYVHYQSREL